MATKPAQGVEAALLKVAREARRFLTLNDNQKTCVWFGQRLRDALNELEIARRKKKAKR